MPVQSILFKKSKFSIANATHWLLRHHYNVGKIDITTNYYRFRQYDPKKGEYYRIYTVEPGVRFILSFKSKRED